jgi:dienelactone hydrolase
LQEEAEGDLDAMRALVKASKDHLASLRTGESISVLGCSMGADWAVVTTAKEPDVAAKVLSYSYYLTTTLLQCT